MTGIGVYAGGRENTASHKAHEAAGGTYVRHLRMEFSVAQVPKVLEKTSYE